MPLIHLLLILLCALITLPSPAVSGEVGSTAPLERESALKYSQAAIGNRVGEYRFLDQDGAPVRISDYLGKPLVVSFIYTSCHHTCPIIIKQLEQVVEVARDAIGAESFNVVTIGFDTKVDTPARMALYARQRGIALDRWRFLSGDEAAVNGLSGDLGFLFAPSPKGFDHLAQITILDAAGVVYRQVYGERFATPMLVEPLKELVFGRDVGGGVIGDWIANVRLFCTTYDPASGRYRFDYSIFISIFVGLLCLGSVAIFVIRAWRR